MTVTYFLDKKLDKKTSDILIYDIFGNIISIEDYDKLYVVDHSYIRVCKIIVEKKD